MSDGGGALLDDPEFKALCEAYRDQLRQNATVFENAREAARAGDAAALSEIRKLAHRIRGTAAMYGFAALTDLAAAVERETGPDLEKRLDDLCGAIHGFLESPPAETPVQKKSDSPLPSAPSSDRAVPPTNGAAAASLTGIAARMDAIREAVPAFQGGDPEARATIQRLLRSLRGVALNPELAAFAAAVAETEEAAGDKQIERVTGLIDLWTSLQAARAPANQARVLVIDDDPMFAQPLRHFLDQRGFSAVIAGTGAEAEACLGAEHFACILLDLVLPDTDGRNLLVRIREDVSTAAIPVVAISAKGGGARGECFALGVDAYFDKPVDLSAVVAAVAAKVERAAEITREARRDSLTGLANRAAFREAYLRAANLSARTGKPLSVALLDVDRFKSVNDTYGHGTGDDVLRGVGRIVSATLRSSDLVARWGGEEFTVLFPETEAASALLALEKSLAVLRAETFRAQDQRSFHVTFSAGIAPVAKGRNIDDVLADADRLLYHAKESGRNRILLAPAETPDAAPVRRKRILVAEDHAITAGVVQSRLQLDGFDIENVSAGREALDRLGRESFDLLLLDVLLPGMDGFDVLTSVRKNAATRLMPVIMLTALGDEASIVRGLESGANDYIVKPFSPAELSVRVRKILREV